MKCCAILIIRLSDYFFLLPSYHCFSDFPDITLLQPETVPIVNIMKLLSAHISLILFFVLILKYWLSHYLNYIRNAYLNFLKKNNTTFNACTPFLTDATLIVNYIQKISYLIRLTGDTIPLISVLGFAHTLSTIKQLKFYNKFHKDRISGSTIVYYRESKRNARIIIIWKLYRIHTCYNPTEREPSASPKPSEKSNYHDGQKMKKWKMRGDAVYQI